jgi:DtxR family Mn-dependent transcriptional regulator
VGEAERLEHAVSPDFEAKLLSKLGPNGPSPHGNQTTPDKADSRKQRGLVLLREAETGSVYMIGSVYERIENYLSSWKNVESGPDPNSSSRAAIATRR